MVHKGMTVNKNIKQSIPGFDWAWNKDRIVKRVKKSEKILKKQ